MKSLLNSILAAALVLGIFQVSYGELFDSNWNARYNSLFSLTYKKPTFFHGSYDYGYPPEIVGWTIYLTMKMNLNKDNYLTLEFPFSNGRRDLYDGSYLSSRAIGNIYIGYNEYSMKDKLEFDIGLRIPIISELSRYAIYTGTFTDVTKVGAFIPNAITTSCGFSYLPFGHKTPTAILSLGSYLMFNTKTREYYEHIAFRHSPASFISYSLGFEDTTEWTRLRIGFSGLKQINSQEPYNGQSNFNFINVALDFNLKYLIAGLIYNHAIGEHYDTILENSLGIKFELLIE